MFDSWPSLPKIITVSVTLIFIVYLLSYCTVKVVEISNNKELDLVKSNNWKTVEEYRHKNYELELESYKTRTKNHELQIELYKWKNKQMDP